MWHVSSRSGVATLRTAIHLLLTYLLTAQLLHSCSVEDKSRHHPSSGIRIVLLDIKGGVLNVLQFSFCLLV